MRSSSRRSLAITLALLAPASGADPGDLRGIRDQAAAIEAAAAQAQRPQWLREDAQSEAARAGRALGNAAIDHLLQHDPTAPAHVGAEAQAAEEPESTITILVSRSLGPAALRDIFRAGAVPGVRIVFRGIAQGEKLMDFVREIHAQLQELDPVPSVELDPAVFQRFGADAVPLMILSRPGGEVARVAGLADPQWLRDRVAAGRTGDLGVRGPVAAIGEPDMIEEIHRRIAALDLVGLKQKAVASYWRRTRFEHLPAATEARERRIDPTVEVKADITLPDGQLLVRAGERVNPLDRLPFHARMVVFDPTDPGQVQTAGRLGAEPGVPPIYLATRFDRDRGWEGFRDVEDALDDKVYLLTPDVRERFALERVPATVEASGRSFLVREYPVEAP